MIDTVLLFEGKKNEICTIKYKFKKRNILLEYSLEGPVDFKLKSVIEIFYLSAVKMSVYEWSENNAMCQSFFFTLFLRVDGIRHFSEFGDIGKYVENTGLAPQTNSSVMGSQ